MTGLDCIIALKALGEETRLRILRLLFKEPLSANTLVSDRYFDNLSGQQAYKCFACRVRSA